MNKYKVHNSIRWDDRLKYWSVLKPLPSALPHTVFQHLCKWYVFPWEPPKLFPYIWNKKIQKIWMISSLSVILRSTVRGGILTRRHSICIITKLLDAVLIGFKKHFSTAPHYFFNQTSERGFWLRRNFKQVPETEKKFINVQVRLGMCDFKSWCILQSA